MKSMMFKVMGRPVPWARTRVNPKAHLAQKSFFTKKEVKHYQHLIQFEFSKMMSLMGMKIQKHEYHGPIEIHFNFLYREPKKKPKHTLKLSRPDLDNLEKTYLDALNGLAYNDDCQVAMSDKRKLWHHEDVVICTIYWLATEEENGGKL